MQFTVKACGIQTHNEAEMAIDAGVDYLGFLIGLTHKAEDKTTAGTTAEIIKNLPGHVTPVMVTHLLDPEEIFVLAEKAGVRAIQIHDDLPCEGIRHLRSKLPDITLIKAVHVQSSEAIEKAHQYSQMPELDIILLDSRTPDRLGGTGLTHDWDISREIVQKSKKPVWLAGGLTPDNVQEAVRKVLPAGVDANSGLEGPDGIKSEEKLKAFVLNARKGATK